MKLKNGEIFTAYLAIQKLGEVKLPVRPSLALAKFSMVLQPHYQVVEKIRNQLINQYGVKTENQVTMANASQESQEKFWSEFNELMEQLVEIDFKEKIRLPEKVCSTCDACHHNMDRPLEIEPNLLVAIEKFVEVA